MLYHSTCYTVLFIRHHFYRIPAVPLRKYLKLPAFGEQFSPSGLSFCALGGCAVECSHCSSRDRSSTTALLQCTVPCPQHRLNYRNMPVGRENALLFFFTVIVCKPYLEQRPVELRRGLPGPGAEDFSSAYATADNGGFPGSWSREQYPQSRYLDTMPREMRTKKKSLVGPLPRHYC